MPLDGETQAALDKLRRDLLRAIARGDSEVAEQARTGQLMPRHHQQHETGGRDTVAGAASITFEEADGAPSVDGVSKVVVTNGSLTDDGGGQVTLVTGGGGSGAPTTADYLVGTAQAGLSAEIVVGTTPGGELGGTWASPTVDATHSGSAHHNTHADGDIDTSGMKQTIILTAGGGYPTTTSGCAAAQRIEAGTNDIDYWVMDFDAATQEYGFWNLFTPDNYNASVDMTARFVWTTAASSGNVIWGIQILIQADDGAIDTAYGTAVEVTDGFLAAGDVHISAATGSITPGGSDGAGRPMWVRVYRKAADAGDTLNGDARLMSVILEYEVSALSS